MKRGLTFLYILTIFLVLASSILYCIYRIDFKNKEKSKADKAKKLQEQQDKQDIELKANQTIRVKMSKTGEIVAMDINDYLRGVVPSEMPPSYDIEALKAQAVVARTYTYRKIQEKSYGPDADVTDNPADCQAFYNKEKLFEIWRGRGFTEDMINEYWEKVCQAVSQTQGMVAIYNGNYIKAYFHASSPEKTENSDQIWGGEKLDYLVSVESKEDPNYKWNKSTCELTMDDFKDKVVENIDKNFTTQNRSDDEIIKIDSYTTSGRVKNVKIGNDIVSAEKLRTIFGLKSTNFTLTIEDNKITFNVIGYGHGLGMSQVGADNYAKSGMTYIDIIKHYYTGVDVISVN